MSGAAFILITQGIHGISYGLILFLAASGLSMIFGLMDILNLSHAYLFMLAAYMAFSIAEVTNFWIALIIAPLAIACIGMLLERYLIKPIHPFGHTPELVLTLGVGMVLLEAVKSLWGTTSLTVMPPDLLQGFIPIGPLKYPLYRIFIITFAIMILCGLHQLFSRTRFGTIVRAATVNADMVSALGINVPRIYTLFFGFGTWLAGLAGVVVAPLLSVHPGLADQVGLDAFVVVVLGGLGSMWGAFLASLLIGLLNTYGIQFIPTVAPLITFSLMVLVLSIKPTGLFGDRQ
jgi:branched-chain amino acid transport system permease protein